MKRWTRIGTAGALAVAALTIGLTSASAKDTKPAGPRVPDQAAAARGVTADSPRPPAHSETVYVPVTPCRIADTRNAVGPLHSGTVRTYRVGGTTGFVPQGGHSGGCGIPVGATAIAASLTATAPLSTGYLRAYPSNLAEPSATILSYSGHVSTGTGATLSIAATTASALKVTNHSGITDLVIDVTGYYIPQIEGMLDGSDQTVYAGSSRILSVSRIGTGIYDVTTDSNVANCTPTVTGYSGFVHASAYAFNGNKIRVYLWNTNATSHVETLFDGYFYLNVSC